MTINIFQVPTGSCINVGCGCGGNGSGGNGSDSIGGGAVPGGSVGGDYSGLTRVIDICNNYESIFLDSIGAWINEAQLLQYVPGLNLLNAGFEELLGVSLQELTAFEGESGGVEFADAFKRWIVQYFDDPFPGFASREQLRTLTFKLPLTRGGTLLMPVVRVWAETADLQSLNAKIIGAKGTASLTGECAALQRSFGREPYDPVSETGLGEVVIGGLRVTKIIDNQTSLAPAAEFSFSLSNGSGFFVVQLAGGPGDPLVTSENGSHQHGGFTPVIPSVGNFSISSPQSLYDLAPTFFSDFPLDVNGDVIIEDYGQNGFGNEYTGSVTVNYPLDGQAIFTYSVYKVEYETV